MDKISDLLEAADPKNVCASCGESLLPEYPFCGYCGATNHNFDEARFREEFEMLLSEWKTEACSYHHKVLKVEGAAEGELYCQFCGRLVVRPS